MPTPGRWPADPAYAGQAHHYARLNRWARLVAAGLIATFSLVAGAFTYRSVGMQQHLLARSMEERWMIQGLPLQGADGTDIDDEALVHYVGHSGHEAEGQALFEQYCSGCHATGNPSTLGPDLSDARWHTTTSNKSIFNTITHGVPNRGMPAWGRALSAQQRAQLVAYIRSIRHADGELPGGTSD